MLESELCRMVSYMNTMAFNYTQPNLIIHQVEFLSTLNPALSPHLYLYTRLN